MTLTTIRTSPVIAATKAILTLCWRLAMAIVQPVTDYSTTPLGGRNLLTDAVSLLAHTDSFCD